MKNLSDAFGDIVNRNRAGRPSLGSSSSFPYGGFGSGSNGMSIEQSTNVDTYKEPHHFHIYATKHNTHITVTNSERNPMISVSCGNIGFRKSSRKHYDSAFQLASYVMTKMKDQGITSQIETMEVVLRGFGAGREAVTKALLGLEGKDLRGKIVKVSDATRLKFGGTRSPKPRRLG